jgi:hypothetical protein
MLDVAFSIMARRSTSTSAISIKGTASGISVAWANGRVTIGTSHSAASMFFSKARSRAPFH